MTNPNPAVITEAEWRLWQGCLLVIPGVRLSGIYANKAHYHNTVRANQINWPTSYSIRLPLDLTQPTDKARGEDLTMSTAEMIKRTGYLRASALHPDDDRLGCLREFYGTLNGTTVYGLSHDSPTSAWRQVSSDASHLWHIHKSFFTLYCDNWDARPGVYGLEGVLSVLSGETWEAWVAHKSGGTASPVLPIKEDQMFAIKEKSTSGVWLSNGIERRAGITWVAITAMHAAGLIQTPTAGTDSSGFVYVVPDGEIEMWAGPLVETSGGGGPVSGPVDVSDASVAKIAAASGKAAADEIAADPERDGKDT